MTRIKRVSLKNSQANVAFDEFDGSRKKIVKVVAITDIMAGQQILVDYNCYDQRASTTFSFLNPSDGWKSATEIYNANRANYFCVVFGFNLELFKLKAKESIQRR